MSVYVHKHVCAHVHIHVCIYVYVCAHMRVCSCMHVYVHVCACLSPSRGVRVIRASHPQPSLRQAPERWGMTPTPHTLPGPSTGTASEPQDPAGRAGGKAYLEVSSPRKLEDKRIQCSDCSALAPQTHVAEAQPCWALSCHAQPPRALPQHVLFLRSQHVPEAPRPRNEHAQNWGPE